jgi:hypothetical protein
MFAPGGGQDAPLPAPSFLSKEAKIVFYSENDVIADTMRHGDVFDKKNGASRPLGRRRNDFIKKGSKNRLLFRK